MADRQCIGYGEKEGKCLNTANKQTSPSGYWCEECEALRQETITNQFQELSDSFKKGR